MTVPRDDFEAALAARRDLGPQYEDAVVESFVDKIEASIERRRRDEVGLAQRADRAAMQKARFRPTSGQSLALGIASLGIGFLCTPITLVAGESLPAMVVVWLVILGVNVSFNHRRRNG